MKWSFGEKVCIADAKLKARQAPLYYLKWLGAIICMKKFWMMRDGANK